MAVKACVEVAREHVIQVVRDVIQVPLTVEVGVAVVALLVVNLAMAVPGVVPIVQLVAGEIVRPIALVNVLMGVLVVVKGVGRVAVAAVIVVPELVGIVVSFIVL